MASPARMLLICANVALLAILSTVLPVGAQIAPTNTATINGSVTDAGGKPVKSASIDVGGPKNASTRTDDQGRFVLVGMPFGSYQITAKSPLGTLSRSLEIDGDVNVAIQYAPAGNLRVIGSVSASGSFNVTPASITQVSPAAAAFDGVTSWRKTLEEIPGISTGGVGIGTKSTAAFADAPYMPMLISINGALPYETATLLDNMPVISASLSNGTGGVGMGTDLNVLPLNGFERADIVRGPGASAPSIVDSIGGSFVLRTPGAVTRNRGELSFSNDPYGGIVANGAAAFRIGRLSTNVAYGVNDSPGPTNISSLIAFSPAPITVNGQPFVCNGSCATAISFLPAYPTTGIAQLSTGLLGCCVNSTSAWSVHSGSASLSYAVSPAVRASLFYGGQNQEFWFPVAYNNGNFVPPAGYNGSVPAGNFLVPSNGQEFALTPWTQASTLVEEKLTANLGRGVLTLAALQNRVLIDEVVTTSAAGSFQLFGGGTLCATNTPACGSAGNPGTATVFNGGTYNVTRNGSNLILLFGSDNRDLSANYVTEIGQNLHAGASFVKSLSDVPLTQNGVVQVPTAVTLTTNEWRLSIGGNPTERIAADLSTYFVNADYHVQDPTDPTKANYTDALYHYAAPRLGLVWRPSTNVAIRAAAGGGFAEAPLKDLVGLNTTPTINSTTTPGFYSQSLQNLNLKPETSFGFDVGMDLRGSDSILSVDVYRTNLFGQVYSTTTLNGTFTGAQGTLPLYVTQFGNLGKSRYEGILINLSGAAPLGFQWSLAGGLNRGYLVSVPANFYDASGATCNFATNVGCKNQFVVPAVNFNGSFAAPIPYAQGTARLGYRWDRVRYVDLITTYYGSNNTYFRPAFFEFDAHAQQPLAKHASLLLTVRNITGIYPNTIQQLNGASVAIVGAPAVAGPPQALYGQNYGPREAVLTLKFTTP